MDFRAWITALITPDTLRAASEKIGLSHSTITRQLSRGTLTSPTVIALCRAYGRSPVDGLVQTGYLRTAETRGVGVMTALDAATNHQLLEEVLRRSDPDSRYLFGRSPEVINPSIASDITPNLAQSAQPAVDDDEGTVADWRPHQHAADDSHDEDQGREDAGSDPFN